MPWVCSVGGAAFVSWYDRRASTPCPAPPCAANNDFADYFAASASLDGNGNLAPGAEFQISAPATSDPECAGGATPGSAQSWSCGARATNDASSCSVQPQLARRCLTGTRQTCDGLPGNPGSGTACDLATGLPACTVAGESCRPGLGNPKYGDYNGNACAAGRVYTVWGSGTSQPGATAANGINLFFAEKLVCCVPQIQGPGPLSLTTCSGSSTTTTANICNTGKADLQINSITSSNSQFTPIQPSSGFPVTISPDFCFPFQVNFTPTGTGTTNASLTVASNDTVNPSLTIPVTGASPAPKLQLTGSGAFGNVCAGAGAQQTISMCNVGACNLDVTAISSSCPDFTLVNPPTLALAISPDSCVNLTDAFTPTMLGSKSCSLTVTSDSGGVAGTMTMLAESGNTPSPMINIPPDLGFPPTVIQSVGSCKTPKPFPISNIGTCNLNIDNVALSGTNATDYGFSGLPSLPSPQEPGHTLGDGNMNTVFGPLGLGRNRDGLLTVTYESNPITHATTNVTRHVCGEGVKTGARLLVTAGGVPLASVSKIQLVSLTTGKTVDLVEDAPLHSVTPAIAACSPFKFHREWGTVSHPIQLLTGFYRLTVTVEISGKTLSKTVSFNVNTCDFNPNIVVNF